MEIIASYYSSPIGLLEIIASDKGISSLRFTEIKKQEENYDNELLKITSQQLDEYFNSQRTSFNIPIDLTGTNFQSKVWKELIKIPFGKTISYLDLSLALGDEKLTRAVGSANGKNPIAIVIPCHRVIGNDGKLTGYSGGLQRKEFLLKHEGAIKASNQVSIFTQAELNS